ncbi:unnamed protein product [Linum tenue]|uniref:Uncharacterized protein n=1 Tax=Linum tenue TaxID=586396 RepID=A0AAV0JPD3_9ROSI|nr:unnamed protein product [Linum tenue]
MRCSGFMN